MALTPRTFGKAVGSIVIRTVALVLSVLLLIAAGIVGRAVLFPPRFDVESITQDPHYQDPELLAKAWSLPVAKLYRDGLVFQDNGSFCGPASVANILRSTGDGTASQLGVLAGTGLCRSGICFAGLTLDVVANLLAARSRWKVTVLRDLTLDELRAHMRRSNDPRFRYLVNFQRGLLFGTGTGHHSPVGGYLAEQDLVLVLDVNRVFGPWLVKTERLFRAVDSLDGRKKRGLLQMTAPE